MMKWVPGHRWQSVEDSDMEKPLIYCVMRPSVELVSEVTHYVSSGIQ